MESPPCVPSNWAPPVTSLRMPTAPLSCEPSRAYSPARSTLKTCRLPQQLRDRCPALRASAMLAVAACLLMGVVLSLSRMGIVSTLAAAALTGLVALGSRRAGEVNRRRRWLWLVPVAIPLCLFVFLPTRALVLRFADLTATPEISKDTRVQIWSDTLGVVAAYPWTGYGQIGR